MSRVYFNEKATVWDETVAEKDGTKLERMAESLDIEPGSTVLDVGTGTRRLPIRCAPKYKRGTSLIAS